MKISKFKILDEVTTSFALSGALAIIIGGGSCIIGLSGTGLVKVGEFFSNHQPTLQRMMFYGAVSSGSRLFFVGVAAAAARARDEVGDEEMERIATRYEEAVERSQVHPQNKQRTWANWQEYEEIKKFCRGCQFYRGGGLCALYGESKSGCSDHSDLPSCTNCKYYSSNDDLLPCAVHPLRLLQNCPDWEMSADD